MANLCRTSTTIVSPLDLERDLKTIEGRIKHEGVSFLTITLADFGKDFRKSLDQGHVEINSSKWKLQKNGAPVFLQGFLSLVFDRESGRLLDAPSIEAIFAINQLTLMFAKILLPVSKDAEEKAILGYLECEQQVSDWDASFETRKEINDLLPNLARINRLLSAQVFSNVDLAIYNGELVPKHGPGATADKLTGNRKYYQTEWTRRLEELFPFGENALPNWRYFNHLEIDDCSPTVTWLEPGAERPVRVIQVPKTQKSPRIIAIEPTCMQYIQQAIMEKIVEEVHKDTLLANFIRFDDQVPNQELARLGSIDGSLATLDLSEASDRLSNQLVRFLLSNHRHLASAVDASRSRTADVFGRRKIRLSKFASMGSALTFPMESIVFLLLILLGIEKELNRPLTNKDIKSLIGRVRVFGDDLVVPKEYVHSVVETLELFGFKVNSNKSFYTGRYRESCGKEYFEGHDVSITRVRRVFPTRLTDVSEIVSLVSLRNQLYFSGLWGATRWLDGQIGTLLRHYPTVSPTSSILGRHSVNPPRVVSKLNFHHNPVVKGYVLDSPLPRNSVDGEAALLKFFLKRGETPFDRDHLERSGRPQAVDIKLRWATPF